MLSAYERTKAWRARPENKVKRAEEARRWRAKHSDLHKAIKNRYRDANIDSIRRRDRLAAKRYRETPEYKAASKERVKRYKSRLLAEREKAIGRPRPALCEVCNGNGYDTPGCNRSGIVFDHCHITDTPRGWLCDRCNKVLGMVQDSTTLLASLASYLEGKRG